MRPIARLSLLFVLMLAPRAYGQDREGVMGEFIRDISSLETKVVGLAKALPAEAYDWRPTKGVRSTGEVFAHVAADNYFLPALMGTAPPADTGINGKDHKTVAAFEAKTRTRDQIIAELEKSFAFLKKAMADTPDTALEKIAVQKMTTRGLWLATATHLHEHLGQLIAYARSNNVTPPWSK